MKGFVLDSFEQKSIVEIERSKGDCVQSTKQQMRLENTMGMVFRLNPECKAYLSVHFIK
jgi:hypothetical protein